MTVVTAPARQRGRRAGRAAARRAPEPGRAPACGQRRRVGDHPGTADPLLWGRDHLFEEVLGVRRRSRPGSFFQTNTGMTGQLYTRVAEAAGLDGSQVVYDLFCGVGSIGLTVARHAREVIGIEIMPEAAADAARNAAANGVGHYRAICGDVGRVGARAAEAAARCRRRDRQSPACGPLRPRDPARARAGAGGARLRLLPPGDVRRERGEVRRHEGYDLDYVQPVDMFPNTPHIEAVARFVRDPVPRGRGAARGGDRRAPTGRLVGGWARYHSPRKRNAARRPAWPTARPATDRCRARRCLDRRRQSHGP